MFEIEKTTLPFLFKRVLGGLVFIYSVLNLMTLSIFTGVFCAKNI